MIVVTTPTGAIGRQVLAQLLKQNASIRVIVRDPARLPEEVRDRVDVIAGSHGDAAVVERAFAGAEAVFWLVPPNPRAASVEEAFGTFARPACAVLAQGGVQRVVGISALGRGVATNAGYVSATLRMDDHIAATGVHYRALTMPSFMDNLLRQVVPIREQGLFFSPIDGDLKLPSCATRDIAATAAGLLLDSSWTGVEEVPVLGPEDLSFNDMAAIMTEVLGKPVRFQQIPFEAHKARLMANGMSDAMAQGAIDMMRAKNEGMDKVVKRTQANSTPTSFRQWCSEVLGPAVLRA